MKKKDLIILAALGTILLGSVNYFQKRARRLKKEKEVKEELKNIIESELFEIEELEEDDTEGERNEYLKKSEFSELSYEQVRINNEIRKDISDIREEVISLYTHLEELAKLNESEE